MENNTKFIRRDVMWRWDGEEGKHILVGVPRTKSAHILNPVGAQIFFLCDGEHTVKDIIKFLEETYPEAANRIWGDVLNFINYLFSLDIIKILE